VLAAGRLRHRVVIQYPVEIQDETNGAINVIWADLATVWAAIEPLSAREFIAAQSEVSKVTSKIIIRYRNDIDAKMRLYHFSKDMYYNIEGILADKDSGLEYITLPVSEGVRKDLNNFLYVNYGYTEIGYILGE
jgi:SPP1 family predicted phage head-tail adaptor